AAGILVLGCLLEHLAGSRSNKQLVFDDLALLLREVKHVDKRSGVLIVRAGIASSRGGNEGQAPVPLDERNDRTLIGYRVIDEVGLGPRRNYEERKPRSVPASSLPL